MSSYTEDQTIDSLSKEQLESMADSDHTFVISALRHSIFDTQRVRLILELGTSEAKRRLEAFEDAAP